MNTKLVIAITAGLWIGYGAIPCMAEQTLPAAAISSQAVNIPTAAIHADRMTLTGKQTLDKGERLYAEPVGDNAFLPNLYSTITPSFILNNDGDRIGVRVELCKSYSDTPCEELTFAYPQLRLDRSRKLVFLGSIPVATFRSWGSRIETTKEYRLGYETQTDRMDTGFDRHTRTTLRIFLEHR